MSMTLSETIAVLKDYYKVIIFYIVFALAQFFFFWGICHLMPGERLYQRKARMKAGRAPAAAVVDPIEKSQAPNYETELAHRQKVLDESGRAGRRPE